jgi:signal transduction histidine kinase
VRPLPDLIEDNLLRIAQEALTNAIKHSGGTTAAIELDYGAKNILMTVSDNGKGFSVENCAGPLDGHFGLLGISERVKRINGQIAINSAPGAGTTVRVEIPLAAEAEIQMPAFAVSNV